MAAATGPDQHDTTAQDDATLDNEKRETIGEEVIQDRTPAVATSTSTPTGASTLQSLTDKSLHFLSHASNETLGACFVGLGAATYMVLGRIGLVFIGVAGGVVLHATWEGIRADTRDEATKNAEQERRREVGVEVARRVLRWREGQQSDEQLVDTKVYPTLTLDYSSFGPETAKALDTFTNALMQDYLHYWYDPAIPSEETFPAAGKQIFTAFLLSLLGHVQRKRAPDVFLDFTTNASSIMIVFLNELSTVLRASPNSPVEEAVSFYLQQKPDSSLAYMLDQRSQRLKLTDAAEDILQAYLDPKAYNFAPAHAFFKQVLTQLILEYTVTMCSRPEWINDWIVYGLEESETTKEVMDIVDAGVEGSRNAGPSTRADEGAPREEIKSRKESVADSEPIAEHKRTVSKAEEAMDEAMREARRLTELMIEEDERRAREERERQDASNQSSREDVSEGTTQGAPTPSSSQSDQELQTRPELPSQEPRDDVATPVIAQDHVQSPSKQFTHFDQLVPTPQPTALNSEKSQKLLTLYNASISIFDDSVPGDSSSIKAKPNIDYLVQIEPENSAFPGWMISRKYVDFETLHEVLRRISVITGAKFNESHAELPKWRVHTKASLRTELERYLSDAVRHQPLAESEGMKRFLEKDQGLTYSPNGSTKGFSWPTPDAFGKLNNNMMNVLTKAPKQVAGGSKAVFGGVAGLVGGTKKPNQSQSSLTRTDTSGTADRTSNGVYNNRSSSGQSTVSDSRFGSLDDARASHDSLRTPPPFSPERRGSETTTASTESKPRPSASPRPRSSLMSTGDASTLVDGLPSSPSDQVPLGASSVEEALKLPPPPSEMPEDYGPPTSMGKKSLISHPKPSDGEPLRSSESEEVAPPMPPRPEPTAPKVEAKVKDPLSERETSVAIELLFAVITELYTLSSVWQFRRTLLTAAKTFLLRPGNPQLSNIRELIQNSLLDSNLSDSGLAHHVYKMRENALPTEPEMEAWYRGYPEKTDAEKEALRIKARKLLVTKGMPQALTSVMGAAASGEALGKVFDCLQVPEVSRGLVFGLMLQALRVITD